MELKEGDFSYSPPHQQQQDQVSDFAYNPRHQVERLIRRLQKKNFFVPHISLDYASDFGLHG
jgi:hypothetical protein